MTLTCIHDVPKEQCSSCRTCQHGLTISRCNRCRAAGDKPPAAEALPSQEYEGYEIYFDPSVRGWYYRPAATDSDDAANSPQSYRSAFLARRAVDAVRSAPTASAGSASGAAKGAGGVRKKRK